MIASLPLVRYRLTARLEHDFLLPPYAGFLLRGVFGMALNHIEPGEPNQNAYVERFNRTFRTEVLDAWLFNSTGQVQAIADDWLTQYNEYRPHDALGGVPPKQFMPRLITTTAADSGNQLSA